MARRIQERVLRHDALILDTTVELAAQRGWPGVLFPRVIESTGLSERPLRDRYKDRFGLAQQVWRLRLEDPVFSAMREVIEAVPAPGERVSGATLVEVLEPFTDPDDQLRAAAELIIVARYQPPLCAAVTGSLGASLAQWTDPDAKGMSKTWAARRAYIAALALGLLAYARLTDGDLPTLSVPLGNIGRALSADTTPVRVPTTRPARFDPTLLTDGEDEAWENLLQVTLAAVREHGYDGATFDVLTELAGVSRGFIQGHYATKSELFADVVQRTISATGMMQPGAADGERAQFDGGVAAAVELRETMRPEHQSVRTVVLEQLRLAWHDDEVYALLGEQMIRAARSDRRGASAEAWQCVDQALLWGAGILAELHPASWNLPFIAVTDSVQ